MATLPYISQADEGIYVVCTTANTDYTLAVPTGAVGAIVWFETSATDNTPITGRIGVDEGDTAVTSITNTSTNLAYHPSMPVEYELSPGGRLSGRTYSQNPLYLHFANNTAGAVVRGQWLYASDRE